MATMMQHDGQTIHIGDMLRVTVDGRRSYQGMLGRIMDICSDLPVDIHIDTTGYHGPAGMRTGMQVACDHRIKVEIIAKAKGHLVLFNADRANPSVRAVMPTHADGEAWLDEKWPGWRRQPDVQIRAVDALN